MNEYIVIKSQYGNIECRISTNENSLIIYVNTPNYNIDRSIQLDDPDLDTKVEDLWEELKQEISNQLGDHMTAIEKSWTEFRQ